MPLFVYVLGLAVFAQGTSEFMASGLVPGITGELSVPVGAAAEVEGVYLCDAPVSHPFIREAAHRTLRSSRRL